MVTLLVILSYFLIMDHTGTFSVIAICNSSPKLGSHMSLYSDIHIVHPYLKKVVIENDKVACSIYHIAEYIIKRNPHI